MERSWDKNGGTHVGEMWVVGWRKLDDASPSLSQLFSLILGGYCDMTCRTSCKEAEILECQKCVLSVLSATWVKLTWNGVKVQSCLNALGLLVFFLGNHGGEDLWQAGGQTIPVLPRGGPTTDWAPFHHERTDWTLQFRARPAGWPFGKEKQEVHAHVTQGTGRVKCRSLAPCQLHSALRMLQNKHLQSFEPCIFFLLSSHTSLMLQNLFCGHMLPLNFTGGDKLCLLMWLGSKAFIVLRGVMVNGRGEMFFFF